MMILELFVVGFCFLMAGVYLGFTIKESIAMFVAKKEIEKNAEIKAIRDDIKEIAGSFVDVVSELVESISKLQSNQKAEKFENIDVIDIGERRG